MGSFRLNSSVLVISLSILLLSVAATSTDFAFAHHKEGHDNGGGNDNGNNGGGNDNGNNGNDKKKNKDKEDNRTDKEKYGKKSKNNLLKISEKKEQKKKEIIDYVKPYKNKDQKIDSKISKFVKSEDPKAYANNNGFDYQDRNTRIIIDTRDLTDETLKKINAIAVIEVIKNNKIQISISIDDISKLGLISEIKYIKSTLPPIQNKDIVIDGRIIEDSILFNDIRTTTTVSIAIIDLAFDENNEKIANNILENISFRHIYENSEILTKESNEHLHGTAMAQIITNMLPDVKLHLLSAGTELEFIDAMDYAISKEVDIITISYTWVNYDTDGKSDITKKVEDAIKSEITVVIPSGNYAENYWEGAFRDTDGDKWHEFENSDEGMTITVDAKRVYEEKPILIYLKWSDEVNNISDFDLTLMDSQGKIIDYSSTLQNQYSDKLEYLYHTPKIPGEYHIGISNYGKPSDSNLKIISVYDKLEYSQSQGSVGVPTDARGAVVAGSLGIDGKTQSYSSVGPTDNGRNVPNILVRDGLITESYDEEPFHGTSASAAYVSGLIAILYSEVDNINPMTVTDLLYDNMWISKDFGNSDLQIIESAGKLSKQSGISELYLSSNEETTGQFTSNSKNNYKIISCEKDMVLIQNTATKDLMCVKESTVEYMIERDWVIQN